MYFLNQIAQHVFNKEINNLDDVILVFPSKRAGLFFKQEFKKIALKESNSPVFIPQAYVIDEFFLSQTEQLLAEDLDVIFLLYKAYIEVYYKDLEEEVIPFDEFYPFGEMVYKDFQEIDNYLVKPEQIFVDLTMLEKIREGDMETFMQFEAVKRFILNFSQLSDSDPKQRFGFFWNRLNLLYDEFHKLLKDRNWIYTSRAYRQLLEGFLSGKVKNDKKVIFAGFNALTKAEEYLVDVFLKKFDSKIFWKYDDVYLGNEQNEGSKFLRYYIQRWGNNINSVVIKNPKATEQKKLEVFNSSSSVAQIKYVAKELETLPNEEAGNTLIVLSDENLLIPFLNSVPENIEKLNVTMGFSIRNSGFYSLLNSLFQVIEKTSKDKIYHKFLISFFSNLKSTNVFQSEIEGIEKKLKDESLIYLTKEELQSSDSKFHNYLNELIFNDSIEEFYSTLISFLDYIYPVSKSIDEISYNQFKKELIRLKRIVTTEKELIENVDKVFLIKIIRQVATSVKVPFEGEPIEGLQIMGPLEIRVLDFDKVYMLSMNDGVYPKNSLRTSLLPFGLRKAFFLPTFETQESIYAHHFYALFQNAESIQTHYSVREGGVGASEKSRFLTQLKYEEDQYDALELTNKTISYELASNPKDIEGFKSSKEVVKQLIEKYSGGEKYLSPTAVGTLLECDLKFYYRYVLGLYEKNDVKEELESVDVGNIIHKALEMMFIDETEISEQTLTKFISKIDEYISRSIIECELTGIDKGYNYFLINASKDYLKKYLLNLKKYAPFSVVATEQLLTNEMEVKNHKIKIGGNLDLIINSDNQIFIIDFKTGRSKTYELKGEDVEELKTKQKKYKHYFQLLYYAYLYQKNNVNSNARAELHYILLNKIVDLNQKYNQEQISSFSELITETIKPIFEEENYFNKTLDEENCLNCPFMNLCNR